MVTSEAAVRQRARIALFALPGHDPGQLVRSGHAFGVLGRPPTSGEQQTTPTPVDRL